MTLPDDVVERVARAMFDHEWAPSDAEVRDGVWRDEAHSGYFIEAARAALEAARYGELVEALNAIIDRGPERDLKWAGMTAKDIAIFALSSIGTQP